MKEHQHTAEVETTQETTQNCPRNATTQGFKNTVSPPRGKYSDIFAEGKSK